MYNMLMFRLYKYMQAWLGRYTSAFHTDTILVIWCAVCLLTLAAAHGGFIYVIFLQHRYYFMYIWQTLVYSSKMVWIGGDHQLCESNLILIKLQHFSFI